MSILGRLYELTEDLKATNSSNKKIEILHQYEDCLKLLRYIYHPLINFHITSDQCKKHRNLFNTSYHTDIQMLLNDLRKRITTGHDAIKAVNTFVMAKENHKYSELIWNIIDRNLKCRIDVKLINKAFPGSIPTFDVSLCGDTIIYKPDRNIFILDKADKEIKFDNSWWMSRKLDGVRTTAMNHSDKNNYYSRMGNEFETLSNLNSVVDAFTHTLHGASYPDHDFVLDGECCLMKDGKEDFRGIVSEIKRKNHTIKNPKYFIFDCLDNGEFLGKSSSPNRTLSKRYQELSLRLDAYEELTGKRIDPNRMEIVKQIEFSMNNYKALRADVLLNGWEGLIFRKDVPYEGKRTKNMLKDKLFKEVEFKVLDVVFDNIRYINPETEKEVEKEMLSSVIISHEGNKVNVGSGFSIPQRLHYHKNPDDIIGKTITVKYFEESSNKKGTKSLRFPTIKHIWENGRDV